MENTLVIVIVTRYADSEVTSYYPWVLYILDMEGHYLTMYKSLQLRHVIKTNMQEQYLVSSS